MSTGATSLHHSPSPHACEQLVQGLLPLIVHAHAAPPTCGSSVPCGGCTNGGITHEPWPARSLGIPGEPGLPQAVAMRQHQPHNSPTASSSSMNTTQGAFFRASENSSLSCKSRNVGAPTTHTALTPQYYEYRPRAPRPSSPSFTVPDACRPSSHKQLHELGGRDHEEGHARLPRHGPCCVAA